MMAPQKAIAGIAAGDGINGSCVRRNAGASMFWTNVAIT
jgi:hypothetical protein